MPGSCPSRAAGPGRVRLVAMRLVSGHSIWRVLSGRSPRARVNRLDPLREFESGEINVGNVFFSGPWPRPCTSSIESEPKSDGCVRRAPSVGDTDLLDANSLRELKAIAQRIEPA